MKKRARSAADKAREEAKKRKAAEADSDSDTNLSPKKKVCGNSELLWLSLALSGTN